MERAAQTEAQRTARRPAAEPETLAAGSPAAAYDLRADAVQRRDFLRVRPAAPIVQRVELKLGHPDPGVKTPWIVDTRGEGRQALRHWIEEAAKTNLPALLDMMQQLSAGVQASPTREEWFFFLLARQAYDDGLAAIRIGGGTYLPNDAAVRAKLKPDQTITMRSVNTGDMYQVRASMVLHPDYDLLLTAVSPAARKQAQMAADVIGAPRRVFYITSANAPAGYSAKTETWTTADIEGDVGRPLGREKSPADLARRLGHAPSAREIAAEKAKHPIGREPSLTLFGQYPGLAAVVNQWPVLAQQPGELNDAYGLRLRARANALENSDTPLDRAAFNALRDAFRLFRIDDLANKYAPYSARQAQAFKTDLEGVGRFSALEGRPVVIVNFRDTGHSSRPGANAPALDTGLIGVAQIRQAVIDALGAVQVVPMGEEPSALKDGPNLLNYWDWPSVKDNRLAQTLLLKYLKDKYPVIGAVGMRSGVMDQLALLGIPIVSIDISPHRGLADGQLPNLATSKGWDRGVKLEDSYKQNYGHAFIQHERVDEKTRRLPRWAGAFHQDDVAAIQDAVRFYLAEPLAARSEAFPKPNPELPHATVSSYRHASHPLSAGSLRTALSRFMEVVNARPISAYALVRSLHPYVSQSMLRRNDSPQLRQVLVEFEAEVTRMIVQAQAGQPPPMTVTWMCDNQRPALLDDEIGHRWYREQRIWMGQQLGMPPDAAVAAYKQADAHYRQPVLMDALNDIYGRLVIVPMFNSAKSQLAAVHEHLFGKRT